MSNRKHAMFEIESTNGAAKLPIFDNLKTNQLIITNPYTENIYLDFEESHRKNVEAIKPGEPALLTMEWLDIYDEPLIVDRVEGLRVYLRRK